MNLPRSPLDSVVTIPLFAIVFVGVILFGVIGCGGSSADRKIGNDIDLYRTDVNGIACIVADGYQSVALSCNWGSR